jgi:hypothetical protein
MNANGDAIAVWLSGREVTASTGSFSGGWNSSSTVSSSGGTASTPQVSIDSSGNGIIVWEQPVISTPAIYASTLSSGSWSSPTMISASGVNSTSPHVATSPSSTEKAIAVWFSYDVSGSDYSNVYVQTSSLQTGGSWTTPARLSSAGYMDPHNLSLGIGIDDNGNAAAGWNTSLNGSVITCQFTSKLNGANWVGAQSLNVANPAAYGMGFDVEPSGNMIAAWMGVDSTGTTLAVPASVATPVVSSQIIWGAPITLSTGNSNGYPQAAVNFSNNEIYATACWLSYNGTNTSIVASIGSMPWPLPPTGLSVSESTANYGLTTNVYNTLSWTASTSPSIASYRIYRNGVLVTSVPSTATQWVDYNRIADESVTYGIQTQNQSQQVSEIATVTWP